MNAAAPLRILVVEDSKDALQMLCELLSLFGHDASGAPDAPAALELLSAQAFDVLLTDVNLPGQSGIALARQAKAGAPQMKIIFASGHDGAMASYVGFPSVWLTKPYDCESLLQALNQSDSV